MTAHMLSQKPNEFKVLLMELSSLQVAFFLLYTTTTKKTLHLEGSLRLATLMKKKVSGNRKCGINYFDNIVVEAQLVIQQINCVELCLGLESYFM